MSIKPENHTSIIEVLGRNHLIAQLIQDDVHAAIPLWDKGVDLVAYFNDGQGIKARGIQLKANEERRWGLHRKYESIAGLLMVYVWHVKEANAVEIYALTYTEAFKILDQRKHTSAVSWTKENGGYTFPDVQGSLWDELQPYRMSRGRWRDRLARF